MPLGIKHSEVNGGERRVLERHERRHGLHPKIGPVRTVVPEWKWRFSYGAVVVLGGDTARTVRLFACMRVCMCVVRGFTVNVKAT
jgi:hypothetical protein